MAFVDKSKQRLILGVTGVAGVGKDTFFTILQRYIKIKRFSLGDILKKEVKEDCLTKFNIDPTNCSRADKETIRDYLVEYGQSKRRETNGRYFIDQLEKVILSEENIHDNICITDIRYDEYDRDERFWLKRELNGFLVYVRKIKEEAHGEFVPDAPANEDEAYNDPKLLNHYDFLLNWETIYANDLYALHNKLDPFVKNFIVILERKLRARKINISLR